MTESDCPFGEHVSAWIDGDLPPADLELLQTHLAGCAECSRLAEVFLCVDRQVRSVFVPAHVAMSGQSVVPKSRIPLASGKSRPGGRSFIAAALVALAALCGLVLLVLRPPGPDADPRTARSFESPKVTDVVAPLEQLAASNRQSRQQQEAFARTLELELRALRLDARISGNGSGKLQEIEQQIDVLIRQLDDLTTADVDAGENGSPL